MGKDKRGFGERKHTNEAPIAPKLYKRLHRRRAVRSEYRGEGKGGCVYSPLPKASIDLVLIGVSLRCPRSHRTDSHRTGSHRTDWKLEFGAILIRVHPEKPQQLFRSAGRSPHEAALAAQPPRSSPPRTLSCLFCFAL